MTLSRSFIWYNAVFLQPWSLMTVFISSRSGSSMSWCFARSINTWQKRSVVLWTATTDSVSCVMAASYGLPLAARSIHSIASLNSGTSNFPALACFLYSRRCSKTGAMISRALWTSARAFWQGARNQCTIKCRAGAQSRSAKEAWYTSVEYFLVIACHSSLRHSSGPRKTRAIVRVMRLNTVDVRGRACQSIAD